MEEKARINILAVILFLILTIPLLAEDWSFLDVKRIGAADFTKKHPSYNGGEVVIIVLDTGVDMGVLGLKELPDGGVKVIDAQDFSGEGDVDIEEAEAGQENNEHYLKHSNGLKLFGCDQLSYKSIDSIYYIGVLDEDRFKNSAIPDVNHNDKTNDQFGAVVFNTKDGWLAYVDLDGDGSLNDEQPIWNYKEKFQSFQFRGRNLEKDRNLAAFALNIFPDENRINFHYDGNGHGSHVAGIAGGYKINGQDGLNGVAPGAKIISLKIGDGRLAGGATTTGSMLEAYEYGIEFAKSYAGPVVFNMSFGVGSEIEGQSEMDLMLDDFLAENERLLFCLSAGNEGPAISTVGLPSAAKRALTVGAIVTKENARDTYGAGLKRDKIFSFSSRGGELNKPDILAPGSASSTVPPYSNRENKGGTSMASPQAAGAAALIMSAAYQQNPSLPINGALIKKALKNSADKLSGYMALEQGSGVINTPKAFEYYKKYIQNKEHEKILDYEIDTVSPIYKSETGETAYWRFGEYMPGVLDKQRFYVNPVFPQNKTADERYEFYRAFNLSATKPWIKLSKKSCYIKGDKPAEIDLYFDRKQLTKPGLYNGKVIAYKKGGMFSGNKAINKEFELMCTVVVPVTFTQKNNYSWTSSEITIGKGDLKRIFFDIPVKASSAVIRVNKTGSKYASLRGYLFDPKGRKQGHHIRLNTKNNSEQIIRLSAKDLESGIWEFDLYSDFRNEKTSCAQVSIAFSGLEAIPKKITTVKITNGSEPTGEFKALNHYNDKVKTRLTGMIFGIQQVHYIDDYSDNYEHSFTVSDEYDKIEFELELEPEIFNLFTDFAINIIDDTGKILKADGLNYRKTKITFAPPVSGSYVLQLIPGFASKEPKNWQASLKESYYMFKRLNISGGYYDFYPKVKKQVDFEINGVLPVAPDGYYLFGEIWLDSMDIDKYRFVVPVQLYTGMN